jgi:hypothetical protein
MDRIVGWGLLGTAGVMLLLSVPLYRRWRREKRTVVAIPAGRETLLARVAALDDAFEAGEIERDEYEIERAVLKQRLMEIWELQMERKRVEDDYQR